MATLAACSKDGGTSLNQCPMSFTDQHSFAFLERLRYQRTTGRFCDVLIVAKERNFNAHRMVLAACSPYFDSILKHNKIVKERVIVNCQNPNVFELVLNYMYSGSVVIDRSTVTELLRMANNLLMVKLKHHCAEYLERYIDAANCLSVKEMAIKYNLPELLKRAVEFFDSNVNGCLLESMDMLDLSINQVKNLLNDPKYKQVIRPDVHFNLIVRWIGNKLPEREKFFKEMLQDCPFQQVNAVRLERLLDYNPFFAQSETSLYIVLQTMHEVNMPMAKYEVQYRNLVQKYGYEMDNGGVDREFLAEMEAHSMGMMNSNLDGDGSAENYSVQDRRPSLKLKINLAASTDQPSQKTFRKKRLLGMKLYRKSVASAGQTLVRRRGRPPKMKPPRIPISFGDIDEEPEKCFYEFNEDIHTIVLFEEPDDLNPDETEAMQEDESQFYNNELEPISELQCEHCVFKTNHMRKLQKHDVTAHSKNILYVCNVCQFECRWNRMFYDHMRQHFPGPPFQCDSCGFAADRINALLSHRLTHTDEKPYKCSQCNFRCRHKSNLVVHCRLHSGERPFKCAECGKGFATKSAYEQHINAHSEDRPFVCGECDFATKYQSHLISHRRIHTGELFRCEVEGCDYSSPKKSQLAAHLRTHLAVRSHQCRVCHRSFIEKSHLVRHERIHLEDKPFKCDNCDYASSRRDKLKEHILKHHDLSLNNKASKRKHRRARQLAQLAAQAKLLPPESTNVFRPITTEEYEKDQQVQRVMRARSQAPETSHNLLEQSQMRAQNEAPPMDMIAQQQQMIQQPQHPHRPHLSMQQHQKAMSMDGHQMQGGLPNFHSHQHAVNFLMSSQMGNQQQMGIGTQLLRERSFIERPSSASFPSHHPETALSPSCFSLTDFHHNTAFASSTPDTELSTPGPQDRNPHSVSNLYSVDGSGHQHHLFTNPMNSLDTQQNQGDAQPHRPMSLPPYDGGSGTSGVPHQNQTAWTVHGSQLFP
ncbi:BTB/POZ domain-containing protein [Ditylenchus destructor]|nr:BTB/POZ domain-containing protein [Ditylenchus destructor]